MACRSTIRGQSLQSIYLSQTSTLLPFLAPAIFQRHASSRGNGQNKGSKKSETKPKRKANPNFKREPLKNSQTYSLCEAMRYLRAFEVGQNPTVPKYELNISFKTLRNGPVIRNQLKFPHGFASAQKIAVICPPDSPAEKEAREAGASIVGEDIILDRVKEGIVEFDRLYCHPDSLKKLQQANVGRILGPRGLMPNEKNKTIVTDIKSNLRARAGGVDYKERSGSISMAVGQIGFSPKQMQDNVKAVMESIKRDIEKMQDTSPKELHEVVLSSTHGPGFPLDRTFMTDGGTTPNQLTVF